MYHSKKQTATKSTIRTIILALTLASLGVIQTGCHGTFALTRKWYGFIDSQQNKFVASLLTWIPGIIIVYPFLGFVDFVILNVIQFWTGSNPISMNEGQKEIQIVKKSGHTYQITATKNRFDITQLDGKNKGAKSTLIFNTEKHSWVAVDAKNKSVELMHFNADGTTMQVLTNNGYITAPITATPQTYKHAAGVVKK